MSEAPIRTGDPVDERAKSRYLRPPLLEKRSAIWGIRLRSSVTRGSMLAPAFERGAE